MPDNRLIAPDICRRAAFSAIKILLFTAEVFKKIVAGEERNIVKIAGHSRAHSI